VVGETGYISCSSDVRLLSATALCHNNSFTSKNSSEQPFYLKACTDASTTMTSDKH